MFHVPPFYHVPQNSFVIPLDLTACVSQCHAQTHTRLEFYLTDMTSKKFETFVKIDKVSSRQQTAGKQCSIMPCMFNVSLSEFVHGKKWD